MIFTKKNNEQYVQRFNIRLLFEAFLENLKQHCNPSFKLPQRKDKRSYNLQNLQAKFLYSLKFLSANQHQVKFVFIDETSLGHQSKQTRCWQLKGKQKFMIVEKRIGNIGILGEIGQEDFFAYQVIRGNINSSLYAHHLLELIKALQAHYSDNKFIIILDNSPVHKSNRILKLLNAVQFFIFTTIYTLTQPYRKIMEQFKTVFKQEQQFEFTQFAQLIHEFFNQLGKQDVDRCIYSIIPYLVKSLNQVEF